MKIHCKPAFASGLLCAGGLLLFASGIIAAEWWQWVFTIAISARYLFTGLSKSAAENADALHRHYSETAVALYGKYALIKTNLPLILLAVFLGAALFLRFAFDLVTPASAAAVFCVLLTVSAAYSIGLDRTIQKTIQNGPETPHAEDPH